MEGFLNYFANQSVDVPVLGFLMLFSCGIAIFHTLIFSGLFNLGPRPKWLFFLVNPLLVGLVFLISPGYSFLAIISLSASIFVFGLIGIIYSGIIEGKKDRIAHEKLVKKYNIQKNTSPKSVIGRLAFFAFLAFIAWLASKDQLSLLLLIIPAMVILDAIFFPTKRTNFYKLQAVLPTSKINAIAIGVVEVVGDLVEIEPLISPHFKVPCIGYHFKIEKESKNDKGESSWFSIHSACKTGIFKIKDETGSVLVDGDGLEFYMDLPSKESTSGDLRYTETYIKNDDYIFLIGYASASNGETIIKKDDHYKVFGAALPRAIALRNKFRPLLTSFLTTLFLITLVIIYIILN